MSCGNGQTLYDVLGVSRSSAPEAVRKAYRRLVLETHPDKISPDVPDEERLAAEQKFREVQSAYEVLSDATKRRQYDFGLSFVRRRECELEMRAKLARERKAWEAEQQKRRDERMRIIREQQEAKEEKLREMAEKMRQEAEERRTEYEKQKAREEQLRCDYKKTQDSILEATRRSLDKVRALQEQLKAHRQSGPVRIVIEYARPPSIAESQTSSAPSEDVDTLLEELRRQNPEWEKRRQEVLRRRAERQNGMDSQTSSLSESEKDAVPS